MNNYCIYLVFSHNQELKNILNVNSRLYKTFIKNTNIPIKGMNSFDAAVVPLKSSYVTV